MANPRPVHDFGKATGQLAKTDRIDAALLALFAERVRPEPRPLPDAAPEALSALLTRRRQLLEMRTAEHHRLGFARARQIRRGLQQHLRWLTRPLAGVDTDVAQTIEASPVWRATEDLLRRVPGIGPVVSRTLIGARHQIGRAVPHPLDPCVCSGCGRQNAARNPSGWRRPPPPKRKFFDTAG